MRLASIALTLAASTASLLGMSGVASAEAIRIAVGHQSMCTDTYTAGIIVKELGLLEKHLPHGRQVQRRHLST